MSSSKRAYPHKAENELRVVVSFSLSGDSLKKMREKLAAYDHGSPVPDKVLQSFVRGLAYDAVEEYLVRPVVLDEEE